MVELNSTRRRPFEFPADWKQNVIHMLRKLAHTCPKKQREADLDSGGITRF